MLAVALLGLRFWLNGALKVLAGASCGVGCAPSSANGVALAIGASPLAVVAPFGRSKNGKGEAPTAKAHWLISGRTQPHKPRKRKQPRPILSQGATPKSAKAQASTRPGSDGAPCKALTPLLEGMRSPFAPIKQQQTRNPLHRGLHFVAPNPPPKALAFSAPASSRGEPFFMVLSL